jgi:hypothetical protein
MKGAPAVFSFAASFEQHVILPRSTRIDRPFRYIVEVATVCCIQMFQVPVTNNMRDSNANIIHGSIK